MTRDSADADSFFGEMRPIGAAVAAKLNHHAPLDAAERAALDAFLGRNVRRLHDRALLIEQGVAPTEISIVLEGWACRFTDDGGGRRRIVALYLPGDVCDFDAFLTPAMDQSIAAIGGARVAGINRSALNELARKQPKISQALWWESLAAAAVQRAWTVNVGRRDALPKVAHLFCELYFRLSLVGMVEDGRLSFPLTQIDIADACGLTPVHVNRVLKELRAAGTLSLADRYLTIHDLPAMTSDAGFDPSYFPLHSVQRTPANAPVITPV